MILYGRLYGILYCWVYPIAHASITNGKNENENENQNIYFIECLHVWCGRLVGSLITDIIAGRS